MKKLIGSVAVALLILILMMSMGSASFLPTQAKGAFITTSTTIHSEVEDKFNTTIDLSSTVTYTGTLSGVSTLQGTLILHHDGSAGFRGQETFTGLVDGIPGTLTFQFDGSSDFYQAIQINNIIMNGTGELAGFHGIISKTGIIRDNGPQGTYAGQISH